MIKIAFYRDALIGDSLVCARAMYAIKTLYPSCCLVIYTNSIGRELYSGYSFIDELYNMDFNSHEEIRTHINQYQFDFFILTQANRWRCNLIDSTNAKKIISLLSPGSFFKPKFHTLFISRNFSHLAQYERMLKLVREIDPPYFDSKIQAIDFSPTVLHTQRRHKDFIQEFLSPYKDYQTIVMVNPFSRTCSHNLPLESWRKLTQKLASLYPHILFIISTYKGNPQNFSLVNMSKNVIIFKNNSDLFNLVELTSRLTLLISPSTGNAHIANNLRIPLLGLFNKRDTSLWLGEHMRKENLIIIPRKKEKLSNTQEQHIITKVLKRFGEITKANQINQ